MTVEETEQTLSALAEQVARISGRMDVIEASVAKAHRKVDEASDSTGLLSRRVTQSERALRLFRDILGHLAERVKVLEGR